MRGSRRRVIGFGAVVLALVAFWAPSFVAPHYTNDAVPMEFTGHPIRGWHFLVDAVRTSRRAVAGTEGNARGIAERYWWASRVDVTHVDLVYVDRRTVIVPVPPGGRPRPPRDRTVRTGARFLWFVSGRVDRRPQQIVGLINMRTGRVVWDILRPRAAAR